MTEYDLEEFVNPCVVEKLAEVYENDGKYIKLLKESDLIYDNVEKVNIMFFSLATGMVV